MRSSLPKPPAKLSREAKAWWRKVVAGWDLDDACLLILESALEAFDRMRQAQDLLAKEGIVVKDRFKQLKQHPATMVERDAKATLLRNIKALGLDLEPLYAAPGRPAGR
jgi:P27 family predicted phage terminase small subunit